MQIYVNEKDIQEGQRLSPEGCPIALAVKRKFPDCVVRVGSNLIKVYNPQKGEERISILQPEAKRWIKKYDNFQEIDGYLRVTVRFRK